MSRRSRRLRWVWRSLRRRRWPQDTAEAALVATLAVLVVMLAALVATLAALVVSTDWAPDRPLAATPLTPDTLLLGGASMVGGT
jgi:hypothetical protein